MKPNPSPFARSRAEALRAGALLDISAAASCVIALPLAITPRLWRELGGAEACRPGDPRLGRLCSCLFWMLKTEAWEREERGPLHRALWFEAVALGARRSAKAVAHFGDHFEPVMTLLCADEPDPFTRGMEQDLK